MPCSATKTQPRAPRSYRRRADAGSMVPCREPQQRMTLAEIDRRPNARNVGQQKVVLDAEQAHGLVCTVEGAAELVDMPSLIAEESSFGDPRMGLTRFPYRG